MSCGRLPSAPVGPSSEEYIDKASGKNPNYPGPHASKSRFDLVLFWSLDRFTREVVAVIHVQASLIMLLLKRRAALRSRPFSLKLTSGFRPTQLE